VDLALFGRRNFAVSTVAMLLSYGLFFGNVVLLPLWLQQYMGYTATLAGLVVGARRAVCDLPDAGGSRDSATK